MTSASSEPHTPGFQDTHPTKRGFIPPHPPPPPPTPLFSIPSDTNIQATAHSSFTIVFKPAGREQRQRSRWSMIYMPPSTQRETGEVFLSMPQWGLRAMEEGYAVDVWKKKRGMNDSNCKQSEAGKQGRQRQGRLNNGRNSAVCWPSSARKSHYFKQIHTLRKAMSITHNEETSCDSRNP